jgi:hypothetical protein
MRRRNIARAAACKFAVSPKTRSIFGFGITRAQCEAKRSLRVEVLAK